MNKNNLSLKEYVNVFISDFADIDLLDGEIFMDLKTPLYPEIKPVYKISNKNRIYSTESNKFLSVKIKKSGNGYFQVNLQTSYKGSFLFRLALLYPRFPCFARAGVFKKTGRGPKMWSGN